MRRFFLPPESQTANVSIHDAQGEAVSIEFLYLDRKTSLGVATISGRRADEIEQLLNDEEAVVYLPVQGPVAARPDLMAFIIARLSQAMREGELEGLEVDFEGMEPTPDLNQNPFIIW